VRVISHVAVHIVVNRPHRRGKKIVRPRSTLVFRLPRRGGVLLELLGPLPSCGVAAKARVHGRAGLNRIHLDRRLRAGRLRPGVYRLTVRIAAGRVHAAQRLALRVDRRHRLGPGPHRALLAVNDCSAGPRASERPPLAALALQSAPAVPAAARAHRDGAHAGAAQTGKPQPQPRSGVESASKQQGSDQGGRAAALTSGSTGVSGFAKAAGLVLLGVLAIVLATLSVLLVRFLRGSWNP
jgi:hypothetical protein